MLKDHSDPRHRPITADQVRQEIAEQERREQEERERPIREAEQKLTATHRKLFDLAKAEVVAGRPDPDFEMPESVKNRRMSKEQALKFIQAETTRFVAENPDYYPCNANYKAIYDYLYAQGVQIEDAETLKVAFERCRYLGLLVERPAPEPEPIPAVDPEPVDPLQPTEELTDGFDIETGAPRTYTQREIWRMSSIDYRKAFKLYLGKDGVDRTPTFRRSRYQ